MAITIIEASLVPRVLAALVHKIKVLLLLFTGDEALENMKFLG